MQSPEGSTTTSEVVFFCYYSQCLGNKKLFTELLSSLSTKTAALNIGHSATADLVTDKNMTPDTQFADAMRNADVNMLSVDQPALSALTDDNVDAVNPADMNSPDTFASATNTQPELQLLDETSPGNVLPPSGEILPPATGDQSDYAVPIVQPQFDSSVRRAQVTGNVSAENSAVDQQDTNAPEPIALVAGVAEDHSRPEQILERLLAGGQQPSISASAALVDNSPVATIGEGIVTAPELESKKQTSSTQRDIVQEELVPAKVVQGGGVPQQSVEKIAGGIESPVQLAIKPSTQPFMQEKTPALDRGASLPNAVAPAMQTNSSTQADQHAHRPLPDPPSSKADLHASTARPDASFPQPQIKAPAEPNNSSLPPTSSTTIAADVSRPLQDISQQMLRPDVLTQASANNVEHDITRSRLASAITMASPSSPVEPAVGLSQSQEANFATTRPGLTAILQRYNQDTKARSGSATNLAPIAPTIPLNVSVTDVAETISAAPSRTESPVTEAARLPTLPTPAATVDGTARDQLSAVHDQVMRAMSRQAIAQGRLTIQLSPRELGTLDIQFSQERGEVQVAIIAREHATRDLLDVALPKLRQSLQDAGVNISDIDVQQQDPNERQSPQRQLSERNALGQDTAADGLESDADRAKQPSANGSFDIYV